MTTNTQRAVMFTVLMAIAGISVAGYALKQGHAMQDWRVLALVLVAAVASRFKLKLPGLNSNMSVNLPFILIAAIQLSLLEALAVGLASTFVQCFPARGAKLKLMPMLFNLSNMAFAVGISSWILHHNAASSSGWFPATARLAGAGLAFFCSQTVPVAAIIALTEGGKLIRIWTSITHLSLPYYVLSAGVTSMVTTASARIGWQIPLVILPAMYATYRSFQTYFNNAASLNAPTLARGVAAGS